MDKIKDIQDLINEKAMTRLERDVADLHKWANSGKNYYLLMGVKIDIVINEKPKAVSLGSLFSTDGLKNEIIEKNKARYIAEETKDFLEKVESLREDVDGLLSNL